MQLEICLRQAPTNRRNDLFTAPRGLQVHQLGDFGAVIGEPEDPGAINPLPNGRQRCPRCTVPHQ